MWLINQFPRISLLEIYPNVIALKNKKNKARCNQKDVMTVFLDVIDIEYNAMVSFGFHQKMFFGSRSSNNGEFLPERTWKLVWIKEIIEL